MTEKFFVILINLSWQFSLIFAMSWLILAIFRIRSALARRVIWLTVVLCPLLLVSMNIVSPNTELLRAVSLDRLTGADHHPGSAKSNFDGDENPFPAIAYVEREFPDQPITSQPEARASSYSRLSEDTRAKFTKLLILVWFFGAFAGSALICAGYLRLRKFLSGVREVKDERILEIFHRAQEETGTSRRIRLFASTDAQTPLSIGFIHPRIVLPERMLGSYDKLRMVLIHETVHLKQLDGLINLICQVIGSFMFFHPLFHLAAREFRISSEEVCDGWAIRLTGTKEDYANCLLELSRACMGKLPISFGGSAMSATRRIKFIFKGEEAFKMIGKKSLIILSVSVFLLILTISSLRLVAPASAGWSSRISAIEKHQRCDNRAGAAFFWVDTTNGKTWYWSWKENKFVYGGQPEGAEAGEIGTYTPCPNNAGGGLFILNTASGEAWWALGYRPEWKALGKPESAESGELGQYMPCENVGGAGIYVLNTATGSGWWVPPTEEQKWEMLNNTEAKPGEIGTYTSHKNKSGAGLFILNTASGQCWWTNEKTWRRLDKGGAEGGEIGTYMTYDNNDGAGIIILSTKTGEGWWTNGGDWDFFGKPSEITESLGDVAETDERKIMLDEAEELFKGKNFEEAIKAYQEVRDKYPDWNYAKHALMMIGLCYDWMGQKEKAIQTLEKSIQEYPDIRDFSPATFYYLGQMYASSGQKEKALETLKECVEISEKNELSPDRFPLKNARESIRKLEEAQEEQAPERRR
jgi:beta-lactamase regulating signal transducer with metallopeptidase domain